MKNLLAVALLAATIPCATSSAQSSPSVEAQAQEITNRLVKQHIGWKTKISSPGASIRAEKVSAEGSRLRYRLYVTGLPSDQLYTVLSWPVGDAKPSPMIEGATLGEHGIVMCAGRSPEQRGDSTKKDDPIDFVVTSARPSERGV
jgi:hypothetical protein